MNTIFRSRITRLFIATSVNKARGYSTKFSENARKSTPTVVMPLLAFSIPLFSKDDEETPEEKLIETIKRSILCIQKEEYGKAEQMLHLALRQAQDQNSQKGITYIYDVMANLAMERGMYSKAEKLFVDVMRRLMGEGYPQEGIKMLHISSKIAHMAHMQGQTDKALQGFTWTLEKIKEQLKKADSIDEKELKELLGMTLNWFGQLLMEIQSFEEAKKCFEEALQIFYEFYGKANAEVVLILNNLCVACTSVSLLLCSFAFFNEILFCFQLDDTTNAKKYLEEALVLAKNFPDMIEAGVLKANLGLLYLHDGMLDKAKEVCSTAWREGKKQNFKDTMDQASYCLDEIKKVWKK